MTRRSGLSRDNVDAGELASRQLRSRAEERGIEVVDLVPRLDGFSPVVSASGRRSYSAEQILELRRFLDKNGRSEKFYVPHRRSGDDLQILSVSISRVAAARPRPRPTSPSIWR